MQSKPTIRAARKADVIAMEGFSYSHSFRGIVAEQDGEVLGICGVMYSSPAQCFSTIKPELKKHKRVFVTAIKMMRDILNQSGVVYAKASSEEATANGLLRHTGFIKVPGTEDLYKWPDKAQI